MKTQFEVCEIKLAYKPNFKVSDRPIVKSSLVAHRLFREQWNEDTMQFLEEFKVMLLNRSNRVLGIIDISFGGISQVSVDLKVIFAAALKAGASCMILAHNHPSGNPKPSSADMQLTQKIVSAASLFNIDVHDHIILTSEEYYSYEDNGMMLK